MLNCLKLKKILTASLVILFLISGFIEASPGWEIFIQEFRQKTQANKVLDKLQKMDINTRIEYGSKYRIFGAEFFCRRAAVEKLREIRVETGFSGRLRRINNIKKPLNRTKKLKVESGEYSHQILKRQVTSKALDLLGTNYIYGGNTRRIGLDCSGFVKKVFKQVGIELPRRVMDQYKVGKKTTLDNLQPGDLLFFNTGTENIDHVGIYLGYKDFIHSARKIGEVKIDNLESNFYYREALAEARRLIK